MADDESPVERKIAQQTASGEPVEPPQATCYRCGAALPTEAESCPSCGQRQRRICFCGTPLSTGLDRCPVCDADWSAKSKIRRRSRSLHVKPRTLIRSAAVGALVTIMSSAIVNLVISAMAERSRPVGMAPGGIGVRLYYAGRTLYDAFSVLFTRLLGGLGTVIAAAAAGAAVGVLLYLLRAGYWRKRRKHTHEPTRRRRSR